MKNAQLKAPVWMLFSRLLLFALFQFLFFLLLHFSGKENPWLESQRWWTFSALITNIVSIYLLVWLYKREGLRYRDQIRFDKLHWRSDLPVFIALFIIAVPLAMVPNIWLSKLLWGSSETSVEMLFRPIPLWAIILSFGFPLTIGFAELPTYFGYIMPRLEKHIKQRWLTIFIPALFLALQHVTLPLIFDVRFLVYRFLMFLPFALFLGICLKIRPRLLPYFIIAHILLDIGTVAIYFR